MSATESSNIIHLICWIIGDETTFGVNVGSDKKVQHLKEAIVSKMPDRFTGIDANALTIWKTEIPRDTILNDFVFHNSDHWLRNLEFLSQLFEGRPCGKHIHIAIKPEENKKRNISDSDLEGQSDRVKRKKVVRERDRLSASSFYANIDSLPAVSLQYSRFGQFLDIAKGCTPVGSFDEINLEKQQLSVDRFGTSLSNGKLSENAGARRAEGLPLLEKIFRENRNLSSIRLTAGAIGAARNDRRSTDDDYGMVTTIGQFKNPNTAAEAQIIVCFAYSFVEGAETLSAHLKETELELNVPALGIVIAGPDIKFYAMLSLGTQFRLVGLTPGLSCLSSGPDFDDRGALYRAFAAASVLQAGILRDIAENKNPFLLGSKGQYLPSVSQLRCWDSSGSVNFRIQEKLPFSKTEHELYLAQSQCEGKTILIKFTRQYSPELHSICANAGHAPALLGYQHLPGGWIGVAMDFVDDAEPISSQRNCTMENYRRWQSDLWLLVGKFHNKGFVHGDLSDANIISGADGCVKLIDFDQGGQVGAALYPAYDLNLQIWPMSTRKDPKILIEDDRRVLKITLENMKFALGSGIWVLLP